MPYFDDYYDDNSESFPERDTFDSLADDLYNS